MGEVSIPWEQTQAILQSGDDPIVKKPKMKEELLKKPPFRFLHDVISEVARNTGYAEGLFVGDELNSALIKASAKPADPRVTLELTLQIPLFQEKEQKLAYLQKIFDYVALTLNAQVPAKAIKARLCDSVAFDSVAFEVPALTRDVSRRSLPAKSQRTQTYSCRRVQLRIAAHAPSASLPFRLRPATSGQSPGSDRCPLTLPPTDARAGVPFEQLDPSGAGQERRPCPSRREVRRGGVHGSVTLDRLGKSTAESRLPQSDRPNQRRQLCTTLAISRALRVVSGAAQRLSNAFRTP